MAGEQNLKIYLTFRDEASGRFVKASNDIVNSMKRAGVNVKKEGKGMTLALDKTSQSLKHAASRSKGMRVATEGLRREIGRIRNMLLVYTFVMRPLVNQIKSAVSAAEAQERAETKLKLALQGSGLATKAQTKELMEYATQLQRSTVFGDEQIINAQAMLATFQLNAEKIKQATPRVLDMARAVTQLTGRQADLQQIAIAVGKGLTGQVGILSRYGVVISDDVKKSGDFNKILGEMDKNFKDMANAAPNWTDQMTMMQNAAGDYKESLGEILTKSPIFIGLLWSMRDALYAQTAEMKKSAEESRNFESTWMKILMFLISFKNTVITLWRLVVNGFKSMYAAGLAYYDGMVTGMMLFVNAVTKGWQKILNTLAKVYDALGKLPDFLGAEAYRKAAVALRGHSEANKKWADDIIKDLVRASDETNKKLDELTAQIPTAGETIRDHFKRMTDDMEHVIKRTEEAIKAQDRFNNKLKDLAKNELPKWLKSLETEIKATSKAMEKSMSDFFFDAITGKLKTLQDYFAEFGRVVLKILTDLAASKLITSLFGSLWGASDVATIGSPSAAL